MHPGYADREVLCQTDIQDVEHGGLERIVRHSNFLRLEPYSSAKLAPVTISKMTKSMEIELQVRQLVMMICCSEIQRNLT
jgi:hypothetical protein